MSRSSNPISIGSSQPPRRSSSASGSAPTARSRGSYPDKHLSAAGSATSSRRRLSARDRRPSLRATETDEVFEVEDEAMSDVPAPRRSSGAVRKRDEEYTCEVCNKAYKHPACLTKHRWQHSQACLINPNGLTSAVLVIDDRVHVVKAPAAAILLHASSLPEDKALWPAAVSPPTSGLLGAEQLNRETLRRLELEHHVAASPPMQAFAQLALEHSRSSPIASTSKLPPTTTDDDAMDEDLELELGDMLEFEHAPRGRTDATTASSVQRTSSQSPSTAPTREEESGSGGEDALEAKLLRVPVNPVAAARGARQPAMLGISAPVLSFWSPRQLSSSKPDVEMRSGQHTSLAVESRRPPTCTCHKSPALVVRLTIAHTHTHTHTHELLGKEGIAAQIEFPGLLYDGFE